MNLQTRESQPRLRDCISHSNNDLVIFGTDNFSQFPRRDGSIRSSCDRALPAASRPDLVLLRGNQNREYFDWLRSLRLGPDNVVTYNQLSSEYSLAQCIIKNPEPILQYIEKTDRKPVYVPWFSGMMEEDVYRLPI